MRAYFTANSAVKRRIIILILMQPQVDKSLCPWFKAGIYTTAVFWLGIIMFFLKYIYLVRVSSSHKSVRSFLHVYALGCFINCLVGDFWVYLGIDIFSQRIGKIYGNRKF